MWFLSESNRDGNRRARIYDTFETLGKVPPPFICFFHNSLPKPEAWNIRTNTSSRKNVEPYVGSTTMSFHILIISVYSRFHAVWISTFSWSHSTMSVMNQRLWSRLVLLLLLFMFLLLSLNFLENLRWNFMANGIVSFHPAHEVRRLGISPSKCVCEMIRQLTEFLMNRQHQTLH